MFDKYSQNNKLELLGKLNASFVHEIRNPLFALKLNLDLIKSSENLPAEINDNFLSCIEAVNRIEVLVTDLLDFSRKNTSVSSHCSINDVTIQAIHLLTGFAMRNHCILVNRLSDNIPPIVFDKNKLLQVIINLVTNAIEASGENQKVIIESYIENDSPVLAIRDFGEGIKEEFKQHIFEDFFTSKKNGTGLGLSICKEILDQSNSILAFESEPGAGTNFYIKFNLNGDCTADEV